MSEQDEILYEVKEKIATITINRPKQGNALNKAVMLGLKKYITEADEDSNVSVIILTAAGDRTFCAGADLKSGMMAGGMLEKHYDRGSLAELFLQMQRCGKPIICRVNGKAIAGGLGLMIACDFVLARSDTEFFTPEIDRGLFPMMIMAQITRNIGRKKAMELLFTADKITADQALEMGMINYSIAPEELDKKVNELAENRASKSPAILRLGKNAFYGSQDMSFEESLRYLQSQLTINTLSEDTIEGVKAFIEKRKPVWKGK